MRPQRRLVIGGVTATLISGGAAGLLLLAPSLANAAEPVAGALAPQAPPTTEPADSSEVSDTVAPTETTPVDDDESDDLAEDETAERGDRLRELLQPLVDDGTFTAEQVDAVVAELAAAGRPGIWIDGPITIHAGPGGMDLPGMHGPGINGPIMVFPGGPGLPGEMGGMRDDAIGIGRFSADVVADAIGIELSDLVGQIRDGATIAEIATASGVDPQVVIDAVVENVSEHLAAAVDDGDLTQEEADQHLADATERITAWVNGDAPEAPDAPAAPSSESTTEDTTADVTETTTSA